MCVWGGGDTSGSSLVSITINSIIPNITITTTDLEHGVKAEDSARFNGEGGGSCGEGGGGGGSDPSLVTITINSIIINLTITTTDLEYGVKAEDCAGVSGVRTQGHIQLGVYTQILSRQHVT